VHGLSRALSELGHQVHVYTTNVDGDGTLDVPVDRAVNLDGVHVHYLPVKRLRRLYWSPDMQALLDRTIGAFDVVHLHSVYLWPTWAAARSAWRSGVPYIVAPRGMLVRDLIRRKSRWAKMAWINLIERRTLAQASGLHVTTELEAMDVRELGLSAQSVYCVPNGIDVPNIVGTPALRGRFADLPDRYALFLSRISWKKGLDRLIEAWQHVPQDLPLVIVGNDDENYLPKLQAMVETLGLRDRVIFAGPANDDEKWPVYARAELFILPSYSENFGNVVAEAMAVGCPVVITREVGLAPLVEQTQSGLVIDGAPQAIAQAVIRLHGDPALRTALGDAGRRAAMEQLSWRGIARDMERIYVEMRERQKTSAGRRHAA
jgi:glycosyltransferase involved in cell wall biosynthesis